MHACLWRARLAVAALVPGAHPMPTRVPCASFSPPLPCSIESISYMLTKRLAAELAAAKGGAAKSGGSSGAGGPTGGQQATPAAGGAKL